MYVYMRLVIVLYIHVRFVICGSYVVISDISWHERLTFESRIGRSVTRYDNYKNDITRIDVVLAFLVFYVFVFARCFYTLNPCKFSSTLLPR